MAIYSKVRVGLTLNGSSQLDSWHRAHHSSDQVSATISGV